MIYEKFVKALGEMPEALAQVEGHGYRYTPLPAIINAIRPILAKHGLGVYQEVEVSPDTTVEIQKYVSKGGMEREYDIANGFVRVKTVIVDTEGNKIESPVLELPIVRMVGNSSAQAIGATITYARRYSLSAFLGIATEEDTDASPNGSASVKKDDGISQKQREYLESSTHPEVLDEICRKKFGKSISELTRNEASLLITELPKLLPSIPDKILKVFEVAGVKKREAEKYWKSFVAKYGKEADIKIVEALKRGKSDDICEKIDMIMGGEG